MEQASELELLLTDRKHYFWFPTLNSAPASAGETMVPFAALFSSRVLLCDPLLLRNAPLSLSLHTFYKHVKGIQKQYGTLKVGGDPAIISLHPDESPDGLEESPVLLRITYCHAGLSSPHSRSVSSACHLALTPPSLL